MLLLYGCLVIGAVLLVADIAGRLTAAAPRVPTWRTIGLVAAVVPGVAPLLLGVTWPFPVTWPYPLIATAYLGAFAVLIVGVRGPFGAVRSRSLRRVGYLGLLLLGALPSYVLLLLAPAILLAGLTLVEPRSVAPTFG